MWQWFHFLLDQVPPGRPVLRLNLDETSVKFWYEPRLGLRRLSSPKPRVGFARQASRSQLRRAFTHVAIICDDPTLQPLLPQILLVNERTVTVEQHRRWKSLPGSNAKLWRGKSAWINDEVFAKIIRELGKVVVAHAPGRQAILLMDAHNCHFAKGTLTACRDYDIWPVIIPARMTSLLQPLDTHVFARFKLFLRTRMHQLMLTGANEDLTSEQVIDALLHSIKGVLQRHCWDQAFERNGFGHDLNIRKHLLEEMAWTKPPAIVVDMPSYTQFAHCFPARHHIPFMQLLSGILPTAKRGIKRARVESAMGEDAGEKVISWKDRLRPRVFGRTLLAKAKPMPGPTLGYTPPSAEIVEPAKPMMTSSGHPLPSLKRFPPSRRGSAESLLDKGCA